MLPHADGTVFFRHQGLRGPKYYFAQVPQNTQTLKHSKQTCQCSPKTNIISTIAFFSNEQRITSTMCVSKTKVLLASALVVAACCMPLPAISATLNIDINVKTQSVTSDAQKQVQNVAIFVLDRSGSMTDAAIGGRFRQTRNDQLVQSVRERVQVLSQTAPATKVYLLPFSGSIGKLVGPFTVGEQTDFTQNCGVACAKQMRGHNTSLRCACILARLCRRAYPERTKHQGTNIWIHRWCQLHWPGQLQDCKRKCRQWKIWLA